MRQAVIVSTARTPLTKAHRGEFNITPGPTLASFAVKAAVERAGIDPSLIEDAVLGCGYPEGITGRNVARQTVVRAGLPLSIGGTPVNRFCASGRQAIAIGSNERATRLSGVNVRMWKIIIYVVAGAFMAVGAVLYSARGGLVQPAEGVGMELNVIAAAVIGGTSLSGGRASIPGALVGAILMETLKKGLTMMGVASEWQLVVTGIVVLLAVFIDNVRRARENAA